MSKFMLSDIQTELADCEPAEAWGHYIVLVATCLPFWEQAIIEMAELTGLGDAKVQTYRATARNAFHLWDDWYNERTPYVKARRNEIDTAISFIRNAALRQNVSSRLGAASGRNVAGALRGALLLSLHEYHPQKYPQLMTSHLLAIAAAKALFPADINDIISQFALPGKAPSDNIKYAQMAWERGAEQYGLTKELAQTYETLADIWQHRAAPKPWILPAKAWKPQKFSLLTDIYYQGRRDFYAHKNEE